MAKPEWWASLVSEYQLREPSEPFPLTVESIGQIHLPKSQLKSDQLQENQSSKQQLAARE